MSNADTKADVARDDPEDVAALSRSSQTGHSIKWKRAKTSLPSTSSLCFVSLHKGRGNELAEEFNLGRMQFGLSTTQSRLQILG